MSGDEDTSQALHVSLNSETKACRACSVRCFSDRREVSLQKQDEEGNSRTGASLQVGDVYLGNAKRKLLPLCCALEDDSSTGAEVRIIKVNGFSFLPIERPITPVQCR